ncbi:hypothetical protein F4808DRAFT_470310 [Astrocystis sublimbata]|nr:hypothetical protein F4808DRAFT_470310 [Astrocystis sublimbata]
MAYHTTMWVDARRDLYRLNQPNARPAPTHVDVFGRTTTLKDCLPIRPSPRSRPFEPFENSVPTDPYPNIYSPPDVKMTSPDQATPVFNNSVQQEQEAADQAAERYEAAQEAADAAYALYAERLRQLHEIPGAKLTAEMRTWNGRRPVVVVEEEPPLFANPILNLIATLCPCMIQVFHDVAYVIERLGAFRPKQTFFFYVFLQMWRTLIMEMWFFGEWVKGVVLIALTIWIFIWLPLRGLIKLLTSYSFYHAPKVEVDFEFIKYPRSWYVGEVY